MVNKAGEALAQELEEQRYFVGTPNQDNPHKKLKKFCRSN
jgi:hypothetical protein